MICRKCGKSIKASDYRFGSWGTGWEHMDCPKSEPKLTLVGRYHYIWPESDIDGICHDPECKKIHFVVHREEPS